MSNLLEVAARQMACNARIHVSNLLPKKFIAWAKYELRELPVYNKRHIHQAALKVVYLINGQTWQDPRFLAFYGEERAEVCLRKKKNSSVQSKNWANCY